MVWKRTRAEHHEREDKSRLVDQFPKDDWNQYKSRNTILAFTLRPRPHLVSTCNRVLAWRHGSHFRSLWMAQTRNTILQFISSLLKITDNFMYHHSDTLHATYYIVQNASWYSISNGKINNSSCIWHTEKSMHINHSSISHPMLPRTNDLTHISSVFVMHVNNWLSNWEVSWAITEQPVSCMQSSWSQSTERSVLLQCVQMCTRRRSGCLFWCLTQGRLTRSGCWELCFSPVTQHIQTYRQHSCNFNELCMCVCVCERERHKSLQNVCVLQGTGNQKREHSP